LQPATINLVSLALRVYWVVQPFYLKSDSLCSHPWLNL